ncbi:MAG TPA: FtsX-like permease family protein [Methanobacterium sp.]|nr:FtsX-like permease family protein [Methanobacterium sp.]
MLDIAFKDFKAKKSRAAMCIIGVMVCVLLIGVINIVMYEMQSSLKGDLGTVGENLYFEQNGTAYPPVGSVLTESLGDKIMNRSEVDASKSTEALFSPLRNGISSNGGMPTMVVGVTPGKEQAFIANTTVIGKSSLVGESKNAVILGNKTATDYNVTVGDTFNVSDNKFKVVGVMKKVGPTGWPLTIDSSMIMSLSYAQNVSDRQNMISTVIIKPSANYSAQTVEDNLQKAYPKYDVYSKKDTQKTIDNNLSGVMVFMNMINAFIFVVSIILIMNVMMMSVKEKTKEIGTMRAIGTKRRSIMALIIYESLILSAIGGIIGILLIAPTYNILGIAMGATDNFNILSSFSIIPTAVLEQIVVVILVIGTFSGLIPAYLANRISPIEALRYE